ncbi:MAG: hypothetical protein EHM81_00140 [Chloroflexi bacterium]|nr:MAG: hypothetical protein EHM81_00140 [Chloroflexota bacterium]
MDDLPAEHVQHMATLLQEESVLDWGRLLHLLKTTVPQIEVQEHIRLFVENWHALPHPPTPPEMALLFETAAFTLEHQREKQKVELIWTGPKSNHVSLRRTDQALIELINEAQKRILIVSFAVYKARNILSALEKAAHRGVEIKIILESPEVSEGKIAYSTIRALGASLREKSRIFIWPYAKRGTTPEGKIGSLHAKIGVADGDHLYLSSANLTDYAMNINMEMGVFVHGGDLPSQIEQHFDELVGSGILAEIADE